MQHGGEPIGERMRVTGRVLDGDGRPVRHQLVEVWQANAGGRYVHERDQHPAPLDPNFTGIGRCLTDADGTYTFTTIKPGPYPWSNHRNAWRPAHIHFSLFGTDFTQRLVTQMYFPGDPLFALDPIYQAILDPAARARLVATYDHDVSEPEWCTGYRWDIVLTGSTPHASRGAAVTRDLWPTPGQTVGPFFAFALQYDGDAELVADGHPDAVTLRGGCSTAPASRSPTPWSSSGRPTVTVRPCGRRARCAGRHLQRLGSVRHRRRRRVVVLARAPAPPGARRSSP